MVSTSNKNQLQFTLQIFEKDSQLNINEATRLYNIPCTTLSARIKGCFIYGDIITNSRKLTALEKKVAVRKVLDLDSQRFPPRMRDMEDIANRLLAIYDAIYIKLH